MFYSKYIFITKGKLAPVWLAANWEKKLTKTQVAETSVRDSVNAIIKPQMPLALRVSGQLLHGVVRIYQKKTKYLLDDCSEAFNTLRQQNQAKFGKKSGGGGSKGQTELSGENKKANETLITLSEQSFNDLFAGLPSDMSLEEIADQFNFGEDEEDEEDFSLMNVARARDILLDEADTFDLSHQSNVMSELDDNIIPDRFLQDESDKLTDSRDDELSQRKEGHSLLMDALKEDLDISKVDGRNKSMGELNNSWNMNLLGDDDDLGADDDGGMSDDNIGAEPASNEERENKALLDNKLPNDSLAESAIANDNSDLGMDLGSFEGLPSGQDLEMDSALLGTQPDKIEVVDGDLFQSQRIEVNPKPKPKKKRKRARKPQTDKVTELRSEIISKQLKDTSDITYAERPSAWLLKEPQYLHDRSKESISALFTRPVTKGYCLALRQLYADTAKIVKRRRTEPQLSDDAAEQPEDESDLHNPESSPPPPFASDYSLDSSVVVPQAAPAPIISGGRPELSSEMPLYDSGDDDAGGDLSDGEMDDVLPNVDFDDPLNLPPTGQPPHQTGVGSVTDATSIDGRSQRSSLGGATDSESRHERADGWSTRTHRMFQYLDNKAEDSFSYNEMVTGKARKTAVGFAYELLVLKTHDLIELEQNEAYGDILLKKTARFKEIKA